MRRFAYLGDHEAMVAWGISFPRGAAAEVTDAHALRKLAGNNHFAEVFDDGREVVTPVVAPVAAEVEPTRGARMQADQPIDHAEVATVPVVETTEPKRRGRPPGKSGK